MHGFIQKHATALITAGVGLVAFAVGRRVERGKQAKSRKE